MARRKNGAPAEAAFDDYRHDTKRKNNPPAPLAAEGKIPAAPKLTYSYSPRLDPALRFDDSGRADRLPELLETARTRALTADEAQILTEALRTHQPWLEWAGKRESRGFSVDPVALYLHERVSTEALLRVAAREDVTRDLFADPQQEYRQAVQFYQHDVDWSNRLILGDSLQVMASLAQREDLAGKVQMIYIDPPYGIKFGSNFQNTVGSREMSERDTDLTREPETIRAYRDTWHLGRHSYLAYIRDRLSVARHLLAMQGSLFIQIGQDNVHAIRDILDEVFDASNFVSQIIVEKTSGQTERYLSSINDYILWYARDIGQIKYVAVWADKKTASSALTEYNRLRQPSGKFVRSDILGVTGADDATKARLYRQDNITSQSIGRAKGEGAASWFPVLLAGETFTPSMSNRWKKWEWYAPFFQADRLEKRGSSLSYVRYFDDFPVVPIANLWDDVK